MDSADRAVAEIGASMQVLVACSPAPGQAVEVAVEVGIGATVFDAIRASGILERFAAIDISAQAIGVWGRPASLQKTLQPGDRVEIYRPLEIDPKEARRQRASRRPLAR